MVSSVTEGNVALLALLDDRAVFHNEGNSLERLNVVEGVVVGGDDVGKHPWLDRASLFLDAQQRRGIGSHGFQDIFRRNSSLNKTIDIRDRHRTACFSFDIRECIRTVSHFDASLERAFQPINKNVVKL